MYFYFYAPSLLYELFLVIIYCVGHETLYCNHKTLHQSIVGPTALLQISGTYNWMYDLLFQALSVSFISYSVIVASYIYLYWFHQEQLYVHQQITVPPQWGCEVSVNLIEMTVLGL